MLRLLKTPHNRRAKDGSLSTADGLAGVGRLAGCRFARPKSLATDACNYGNRVCPRSPHCHFVAASRGNTTKVADYYYSLQPVGRKTKDLGERLFMVLLLRLVDEEHVYWPWMTRRLNVMDHMFKGREFTTTPHPDQRIRSTSMVTFG